MSSNSFVWKDKDTAADDSILNDLKKYKVLNILDMIQQQKDGNIPNLKKIHSKYVSVKKRYPKCKLVYFMRHGQGIHNRAILELYGLEKWKKSECQKMQYMDAPLTSKGINQAKKLQPKLACVKDEIELIIISPLRRAIQTASYSILPLIKSDFTNVVILEYARERLKYFICDQRISLNQIKKEWRKYDFIQYEGFESNEDNLWNNAHDESLENLWKRMAKLLTYIFDERKENVIVYSGHSFAMIAIMQLIHGMPVYKPPNATILPVIITELDAKMTNTL